MGSLVEFSPAAASANIREWTRQNKENIGMAGRIEKSLLIAIAFAALALPQAGWAHGPSRQKITETIEIDAPPAKVWAAIADFHDMSWLPGVAKTTGEGGIATIKGAAPFDCALATFRRKHGDGRGIIVNRQNLLSRMSPHVSSQTMIRRRS
jgi:Polyketide cyclase / dehydrase and lipid transport